MKCKIENKNGLVLATENKYCTHDLEVVPKLEDKTFTENGVYPVSDGHAGYGEITVDVQPNLEPLNVTEFGQYTLSPSEEAYGFSDVAVNLPIEQLNASKNGTYTCSEGGYTPLVVNVSTLDDMFENQQNIARNDEISIATYLGLVPGTAFDMGDGSQSAVNSLCNNALSSIFIIQSKDDSSMIAASTGNGYRAYYRYFYNKNPPWYVNITGHINVNGTHSCTDISLVFTKQGTYYVFFGKLYQSGVHALAKYIVS